MVKVNLDLNLVFFVIYLVFFVLQKNGTQRTQRKIQHKVYKVNIAEVKKS